MSVLAERWGTRAAQYDCRRDRVDKSPANTPKRSSGTGRAVSSAVERMRSDFVAFPERVRGVIGIGRRDE